MRRFIRTAAVIVALGIPAIAAAPASADGPLGGCPPGGPGGGWQLIWSPDVSSVAPPYPWGPGADFVDQHGNNDGYACKVVFTNGAGEAVRQVIDNLVREP